MSDTDLAAFFQAQWKLIGGLLGGTGLGALGLRHLYKRLHPEQQAFVDALGELDALGETLESIIGIDSTHLQDCERIRAAYVHRRKVGASIKDLLLAEERESLKAPLLALSRNLGVVEDLLHNPERPPAATLRIACADAATSADRVRASLKRFGGRRASVMLFGHRRFELKDKG